MEVAQIAVNVAKVGVYGVCGAIACVIKKKMEVSFDHFVMYWHLYQPLDLISMLESLNITIDGVMSLKYLRRT